MVCDESLAFVARDYFELDSLIVFQDQENLNNFRTNCGNRVYSDVLEALLGIVYIDLGIERASLFAKNHVVASLAQFDQATSSAALKTIARTNAPRHPHKPAFNRLTKSRK
jgi:dsRNA-specific ribonuclease